MRWIGDVLRRNSDLIGIVFVLIVLSALFSILVPDSFPTRSNFMRILLNVSSIGVMALGEAVVIIIKGIDLSVSSAFALSGVVAGLCVSRAALGVPESVMIALACGMAVGMVNGFLVLKGGLTPFIATFGMLSVVRGLTYALSGGYTVSVYKPSFTAIGMSTPLGVPMPAVIFIVLAILAHVMLRRTSFGLGIYATGGNDIAAAYSGIRTNWVKFFAYSLCGLLAGAAGILSTAKLGLANSAAGLGYELDVITAVILGGVSFKGGVGNAVGVALGAVVMGVIRNGLLLLNVSAYYQTLIIGVVILLVVSLDAIRDVGLARLLKRRAAAGRTA